MDEHQKYLRFIKVCEDAVSDDKVFSSFKQNFNYTYMLEQHWNTTENIGFWVIDVLKSKYGNRLSTLPWEEYRKNDQVGGTRTHNYEVLKSHVTLNDYHFSHTTLRYILTSLDIIFHLSTKVEMLDVFRIAEIGGGYGGQCKILVDTFKFFHPRTRIQYHIFDLPPVIAMIQKYIERIGVDADVKYHLSTTYTQTKEDTYDLCISTYTIGEIGLTEQENYVNDIILRCESGFMVWNHSPINNTLQCNKKLDISDESPLVSEGNKMVKF